MIGERLCSRNRRDLSMRTTDFSLMLTKCALQISHADLSFRFLYESERVRCFREVSRYLILSLLNIALVSHNSLGIPVSRNLAAETLKFSSSDAKVDSGDAERSPGTFMKTALR